MKLFIKLFYILAAIGLVSCYTSRPGAKQSVADMYKKESALLHPEFVIYHIDDYQTQIHFKLNSRELLYTKQANELEFSSRIYINYKLYPSYESKTILDSATIKLVDKNNDQAKDIFGSFFIKASTPNIYVIELLVIDINRNQFARRFITINKSTSNNAQNFKISLNSTKLPLFSNNIPSDESLDINYRYNKTQRVFGKLFKRDYPIASPPFAVNNFTQLDYKADSTFSISLNDSTPSTLHFTTKGLYFIQADTNVREGLTLFKFYDDFPQLRTVEQLVYPLRYITSRQEYDNIVNAKNPKIALDNFWVDCAGSQERGRDLIRKFYNRVKDANEFFSSYIEGWKTDRGMIYLIYGPPTMITRTKTSETWTYGEENNLMSLSFNFEKIENPFTNNDYQLERSPVYKNTWYQAVDLWRQGRIYIEN